MSGWVCAIYTISLQLESKVKRLCCMMLSFSYILYDAELQLYVVWCWASVISCMMLSFSYMMIRGAICKLQLTTAQWNSGFSQNHSSESSIQSSYIHIYVEAFLRELIRSFACIKRLEFILYCTVESHIHPCLMSNGNWEWWQPYYQSNHVNINCGASRCVIWIYTIY